ncbi:hypothetical protein EAO76_37375 [Streptomyces sp. sk2.1]|nr:hypothetical protein EAO76_37375 [Streptomyces sp. sk2.1]
MHPRVPGPLPGAPALLPEPAGTNFFAGTCRDRQPADLSVDRRTNRTADAGHRPTTDIHQPTDAHGRPPGDRPASGPTGHRTCSPADGPPPTITHRSVPTHKPRGGRPATTCRTTSGRLPGIRPAADRPSVDRHPGRAMTRPADSHTDHRRHDHPSDR